MPTLESFLYDGCKYGVCQIPDGTWSVGYDFPADIVKANLCS